MLKFSLTFSLLLFLYVDSKGNGLFLPALENLGIKLEANSSNAESLKKSISVQHGSTFFEFHGLSIQIRPIKIGNEQAAYKYVRHQILANMKLYEPRKSPYTDDISQVIKCKESYKPQLTKVKTAFTTLSVLSGYGNRMTFGACDNENYSINISVTGIYIPSKSHLLWIEARSPRNKISLESHQKGFQSLLSITHLSIESQ